MICIKCEQPTDVSYTTKEGPICLHCKLKIDPPVMTFSKLGAAGMLYNVHDDEYECYMDMEDFETCGWFIRRKTISVNSKKQVEANYFLEYHGNTACGRCKERTFPPSYPRCNDTTCCISRSKYTGMM